MNSTETRTLPYVEWMASANLIHEAGHPGLVLCDNLKGSEGEVGERAVQDGGTHLMANSC